MDDLAELATAVLAAANLSAPIAPVVLATLCSLLLTPRSGALLQLEGKQIIFDDNLRPEQQEALLAIGVARYLLINTDREASVENERVLARMLCGRSRVDSPMLGFELRVIG